MSSSAKSDYRGRRRQMPRGHLSDAKQAEKDANIAAAKASRKRKYEHLSEMRLIKRAVKEGKSVEEVRTMELKKQQAKQEKKKQYQLVSPEEMEALKRAMKEEKKAKAKAEAIAKEDASDSDSGSHSDRSSSSGESDSDAKDDAAADVKQDDDDNEDDNEPLWKQMKFTPSGIPLRPFTQRQVAREMEKRVELEMKRQLMWIEYDRIMSVAKEKAAAIEDERERGIFLQKAQDRVLEWIPGAKVKDHNSSNNTNIPVLSASKQKELAKQLKLKRKQERRAERMKVIEEQLKNGEITKEQLELEKSQRIQADKLRRQERRERDQKNELTRKRIMKQGRENRVALRKEISELESEINRLNSQIRDMGRKNNQK